VRRRHKIDEVLPCPEPRVDVEEVLDPVTVVGIQVRPLSEDGTDPERSDAELLEVVQASSDAAERAPLPPFAGLGPLLPAPAVPIRSAPQVADLLPGQHRPAGLTTVTEAIREQEVQDLVPPVHRRMRGVVALLNLRGEQPRLDRGRQRFHRASCALKPAPPEGIGPDARSAASPGRHRSGSPDQGEV
jgi:hypothetical protein